METYSIEGAIDEDNARRLRHHVLSLLRSAVPSPPNLSRAMAVACGGNAEALVRLAPGPLIGRTPTINVRLLKDQTWRLLALDVAGTNARIPRAKRPRGGDGNRRDHHHDAREMAGSAVMLVPGVGVREGILLDLVAEQYSAETASEEEKGRAARSAGRGAMVWAAFRITTHRTPSKWRRSRFRSSTNCGRFTKWAPICGRP